MQLHLKASELTTNQGNGFTDKIRMTIVFNISPSSTS